MRVLIAVTDDSEAFDPSYLNGQDALVKEFDALADGETELFVDNAFSAEHDVSTAHCVDFPNSPHRTSPH